MSMQTLEVPGGELVLRLEGGFGAGDARQVREAIRGADCPVVLDFTRVERFEDCAFAIVAPDLVGSAGLRVRVRGLGQHQRRILGYFGVKGDAGEESARGDADPVGARA
jgi:hypothetical protein